MEQSCVIDNYYNATAPTSSGLPSLFISHYPYREFTYRYLKPMRQRQGKVPRFSSIIDILHLNGYTSFFASADLPTSTIGFALREFVGFKNVYSPDNYTGITGKQRGNYDWRKPLRDDEVFELTKTIMLNNTTQEPFIILSYFMETHSGVDSTKLGNIGYKNNENIFLNSLHNFDYAFGTFMQWFYNSPFAQNTIILLTTDHTHFYDRDYKDIITKYAIAPKEYFDTPSFAFDKVPLIIYNVATLPAYYDANGKTNMYFAATLAHILGYKKYRNAFYAGSLFDVSSTTMHPLYRTEEFFCSDKNTMYPKNYCEKIPGLLEDIQEIKRRYYLEYHDLLFDKQYMQDSPSS